MECQTANNTWLAYRKTAELEAKPEKAITRIVIDSKYWLSQKPTPDHAEQVFYHRLKLDSEGKTSVALINRKLELGVSIHFSKNQLFNFKQWKLMGQCDYVLGLKPCNNYVSE